MWHRRKRKSLLNVDRLEIRGKRSIASTTGDRQIDSARFSCATTTICGKLALGSGWVFGFAPATLGVRRFASILAGTKWWQVTADSLSPIRPSWLGRGRQSAQGSMAGMGVGIGRRSPPTLSMPDRERPMLQEAAPRPFMHCIAAAAISC